MSAQSKEKGCDNGLDGFNRDMRCCAFLDVAAQQNAQFVSVGIAMRPSFFNIEQIFFR